MGGGGGGLGVDVSGPGRTLIRNISNSMRQFLDRAAMSFAARAFGALVNSVAVWAAGAYRLTARLGVGIAPALTANWLYPRLVWGGLWGFLFLLPLRGRGGCGAWSSAWRLRPFTAILFPQMTGAGPARPPPRPADAGVRAGDQRRLGACRGMVAAHLRPSLTVHNSAVRSPAVPRAGNAQPCSSSLSQ